MFNEVFSGNNSGNIGDISGLGLVDQAINS